MKKHRIRPTALILRDRHVLLIEYEENGEQHYNLPGGGLKKGETLIEGLVRELREEANVQAEVGPIAFIYEFHPLHQSGDYSPDERPSLHIVFACTLPEEQVPELPLNPDPMQVGVRWVPLHELGSLVLYPNIADYILKFADNPTVLPLIEDKYLQSYERRS
ncbi:hypothetical protein XYCOK13_24370 [Xylanibacillus composti]|uniref:Nudix hydrolase domain-containing protein n=1 Tax=Xylanibacillus composti TaxID=1572762 RepID=A0A8J4H289_9BACL|nr:NUDIX domain-containing protein [Xylanibacillus composti]GIQ69613.1 hypothetical protein XYCOK13_24370 [Xylanibacillus composti]